MVGIVVVSHSARLATGVVELAGQMAGSVRVEPAGGMADPEGEIGTDAGLVAAAIERADQGDGVLVLMDLGSAVMSAELAVEMGAGEGREVRLCEAPLVEGAVAAAAMAAGGASLDEVAREARAALGMKVAQLGGGQNAAQEPEPAAADSAEPDAERAELPVVNALGLHARPAARVVETVARFDALVRLGRTGSGSPAADARSLSALITLGVRRGETLVAAARGPEASLVLDALRELASSGFGEGGPARATPAGESPPTAGHEDEGYGVSREEDAGPAPEPGSVLRGLAASPGIGIGPAFSPGREPARGPARESASDPKRERERLDVALHATSADLERLRDSTAARAGEEAAGIFAAQALLLTDSGLLEPARRAIAHDGAAAESAWTAAAEATAASFAALGDPYLRERAADVREAADRVLAHLTGTASPAGPTAEGEGVLVAHEVTPGQVAGLDPTRIAGIATAAGGATSHAAILARALGIPAVMGAGAQLLAVTTGTTLVVDGDRATVEVGPREEVLAEREREREGLARRRARARERAHDPAVTTDGERLAVEANLGDPAELDEALAAGAEGVGLLRTEFLFLDRPDVPGEDEQREVYATAARALDGRPLVIRTLDAGADKPLPYLRQEPEDNPYLGLRGIRLSLARPEIFDTQLRALAAVAAEHPVQLMFPMVSTLAEFREARRRTESALRAAGAAGVPIGLMVEVPAVALAAGTFAAEADFLSIGTNDLAQYVMAAERGHPLLGTLLEGPPPAVLELIAAVVAGARPHGCRVAVCGEIAGEPGGAALLAGLGVRELSMAPSRIPEVKEALRGIDLHHAAEAARRARQATSGERVGEIARALVSAPAPTRR